MYLKFLEINGFKSFPDKVKLEFGKGLTAVVGPNGSGKSNISDAVRWVLGEQSSKTLRGDKMEDFIFGGTQLRRPMGFAQVTLTIGNDDRDLPIDTDEISITRKLYRSGDSEYRINDNAVRLRDIHELFMDTGLGRDGYSMIGQGKIAEIISAKSQQRREIFEEAAGISKYRYRKNEAERKLSQTQENLLRLRDIMTELEDRVGPLQAQSEKAKKFLELAEKRKELELSLWVTQLDKMTVQLRELDDRETVAQLEQSRVEEELAALEQKMEDLFAEMQRSGGQIEQIRENIASLEEEIAAHDSAVAVWNNDIFHNDQQILSLRREQENTAHSQEDFDRFLEEKETVKADIEKELQRLEKKKEEILKQGEDSRTRVDEVSAQIEEKRRSEGEETFRLNEAKMLSVTCHNAMEDAGARKALLLEGREEKEEKRLSVEKELSQCRSLLESLESTLMALSNSARGLEMKLQSRLEKQKKLLEDKDRLEMEVREAHQRMHLLEELERNMEGFAHSVKFVLGKARSGALGGIHGALSSLLKVDGKYLTAIETAAGAALQNIVVDDENAAKRAIGLLKSSSAGRATFLPLSSVKGNRLTVSGLDRFDGFLGIGADLVTFDETYRGIVESVLGRIAVVTDLDEGIRMAKQYQYKFRIVTLDGQLVNAGGSMTGGSAAKSTGILSRRGEIDRLNEKAAALQEKADGLNGTVESANREIASLQAQLSGIEAERKTAAEDQIRYLAEEKRLAQTLQDLQADRDRSQEQIRKLEEQIESLQAQNKENIQKLADHQSRLTALQEELVLLEQNAQAARLERELALSRQNSTQMEIMAVEQKLALTEQEIRQQQMFREDRIRQLQVIDEQIAQLAEQNRLTEEKIGEGKADSARKREQIGALRAEIAAQTEHRQNLEGESTRLRQTEKEIVVQKEKHAGEQLRLQDKKAAVQKDYDNIISKMWDEYEITRSQAEAVAQPAEDTVRANRQLGEIKGKIRALGTVNLEAIEEYEQVSERYRFMSEQIGDVERSKAKLQQLIHDLTGQMRDLFTDSFVKINRNFSEIFVDLFGGGKAQLKLTEGEDVLESGIEISVQPPGKIIKNLASLSGGEQAFVAIAIYFAILKERPAPFCLLDEIEAALDDVNVNKYAEYLQKLGLSTQFIAITHRRGTMEHADVLYGVTMQEEGVSKILTLEVSEIENKLGMKNI